MRILIVGSAPSVEVLEGREKELESKYDAIYCMNNAWAVLKRVNKIWCHSTDFFAFGTVFPTNKDKTFIKEEFTVFINTPLWYHDAGLESGTIFLNTLYHVINVYGTEGTVVDVIGSDFDYSNKEKTHFYGLGKFSGDTKELLTKNANEYSEVAADPFRYGIDKLTKALEKTLTIPNVKIRTLSPNPNQLLPYEKISLKNIINN